MRKAIGGLLVVILGFALLLWVTPCQAAIAHAQSKSCDAGSCAFASNVSSGSLIVVAIPGYDNTATITSVSGQRGESFVRAFRAENSNTHLWVEVWYGVTTSSGSDTITATKSSGYVDVMYIHEYTGIATSSPLDQTSTAEGSGTALDSGSKTTTQADELIFGVGARFWDTVTMTPGANFTERNDIHATATEDRIVSSIASYSATMTASASGYWVCGMATFKASVAGDATPVSRRTMIL